jgi:hypothetical protein
MQIVLLQNKHFVLNKKKERKKEKNRTLLCENEDW